MIFCFPALLARLGIVNRKKGDEAFDLAVSVMVSGGMRTVLRASDFFIVSLALRGSAVAGLELGFQYYFIGFGLALGLSSGTISLVSRFVGAGEPENANFAVKQSLWIALTISVPLTLVTWVFAEEMVGLFTDDPATNTTSITNSSGHPNSVQSLCTMSNNVPTMPLSLSIGLYFPIDAFATVSTWQLFVTLADGSASSRN